MNSTFELPKVNETSFTKIIEAIDAGEIDFISCSCSSSDSAPYQEDNDTGSTL